MKITMGNLNSITKVKKIPFFYNYTAFALIREGNQSNLFFTNFFNCFFFLDIYKQNSF